MITINDPLLPDGQLDLSADDSSRCEHIAHLLGRADGGWRVIYAVPQPYVDSHENPMAQHTETGGEWLEFRNGYERDEYLDEHALLPSQFLVERYEHGLVRYDLAGESSQVDRRFDVAHGVAVLTVPLDVPAAECMTYARALLEQYTAWCNGELWRACCDDFDRDGNLTSADFIDGFFDLESATDQHHWER